jgi:preprotein translocase subunit SecF
MIDFLRYRFLTACISLSMMIGFTSLLIYRYTTRGSCFSYSIDFTGGTQVLLRFNKPISAEKVKEVLSQEWSGIVTRDFSDVDVLVRVKEFVNDSIGLSARIKDKLENTLSDYTVTIEQTDAVGPGVGETLRFKSLQFIILALLAMLLYIAWRFWSAAYALGAVIALFHDAIAILLVFLVFDIEISVNIIAAIVAVLGYSINDTIVIFSQIRNNTKRMGITPLHDVVNFSLNQTLTRTMLTSISTGLPVLAMFLFGGEALHDFSLALLIGIIFGTYSSIYIASPIMMALTKFSPRM